jgi:hypothetical protein
VLRDHTVAVFNKVREDVEHLWFEFARLAGTAEFIQSGVEFVVPKDVDHACPPCSGSAQSRAIVSNLWDHCPDAVSQLILVSP